MRIKIIALFIILCVSYVANIRCEYIVTKIDNEELVPLDIDDDVNYKKIYKALIAYQWPTNLLFYMNAKDIDYLLGVKNADQKLWEQDYIWTMVKGISDNYRITYVPNTIYQLFVIHYFITHAHDENMAYAFRYLDTFFSTFCGKKEDDEKFHMYFTTKIEFENECRTVLDDAKVISAHKIINDGFGEKYIKKESDSLDFYAIAAEIIKNIIRDYAREDIIKDFGNDKERLLKEGFSDDIRAALQNEYEGNTLKKDSIVRKCIDAEIEARISNHAILMRGTKPFYQITSLPKNNDELFAQADATSKASTELLDSTLEYKTAANLFAQYEEKTLKSRVLCYGIAPFIGGLLDKRNMPYAHAIKPDNYFYALFIDKKSYYNNNCNNLFIIPLLSAFLQVFGHTSMYYAASKVAMEEVPPKQEVEIEGCGPVYDAGGLLIMKNNPIAKARSFAEFTDRSMFLLKQPEIIKNKNIQLTEESLKQGLQKAADFFYLTESRQLFSTELSDPNLVDKKPYKAIINRLEKDCKRDKYYIYKLSNKVFDSYKSILSRCRFSF